jgi:hypothetical protein
MIVMSERNHSRTNITEEDALFAGVHRMPEGSILHGVMQRIGYGNSPIAVESRRQHAVDLENAKKAMGHPYDRDVIHEGNKFFESLHETKNVPVNLFASKSFELPRMLKAAELFDDVTVETLPFETHSDILTVADLFNDYRSMSGKNTVQDFYDLKYMQDLAETHVPVVINREIETKDLSDFWRQVESIELPSSEA